MNNLVMEVQKRYSEFLQEYNYSIIDIEEILLQLAKEGLIWCIKDMKLSKSETILINHFLKEHREKQIYDPI